MLHHSKRIRVPKTEKWSSNTGAEDRITTWFPLWQRSCTLTGTPSTNSEEEFQEADRAARSLEVKASEAREARASALAHEMAAKEKVTETRARINEALQCTPEDLPTHLINLKPESSLSEFDIERKIDRLSNAH